MTQSGTRLAFLAATLTAFAALGCKAEITSGSGPADAITGDVGISLRDEVEDELGALTLGSSLDPLGTTPAAAQAASLMAAPCVTPSSGTDSDGDGVPDNATYVFTAPPCRFTGWRGGTLDVVGQLQIQDPAPTSAGFGYAATLTELRSLFIGAAGTTPRDIRRNGSRTLSGSVASLLLVTDLQVQRNFDGHPDANIDKQWTVTFTPAISLQINAPLPSGALDISGTIAWSRGTAEDFSLVVTTPTPLQYDASCTDTVQRIKAGELHAAGTFGDMQGFVRVRWTKCGEEPRFTFDTQ